MEKQDSVQRKKQPMRTIPKGVIQCPVTPFFDDGRIDFSTFEKVVDFHIKHEASSVCVALHIAESLNLTIQEHKESIEVAVRVANGRLPVIADVRLSGTDQVIDLARHAEKVGADAVMCITPYYWPSTEESQFRHFVAVGSAIGIPLIGYNSPVHQGGVSLSPRLLVRLIESMDNFIGLKDASTSFEYFIEARRATQAVRPDFGIFTGVEYILPSMVLGGGVGSMSVTAGVAPNLVRDLYKACKEGRYDEARNLQDKASYLWQLFKVGYPAPIKAAMEIMGRPVGETRLPILPVSKEGKRQLLVNLQELGIIDQEPHGW
ncbi:MAG: dihydrodipicolinate synthase family protein [Deltaproteobacteria bacterium]